jgi:hypothetical protein
MRQHGILGGGSRIPVIDVKLLGEGDHNIRAAATASVGAMAAYLSIVWLVASDLVLPLG